MHHTRHVGVSLTVHGGIEGRPPKSGKTLRHCKDFKCCRLGSSWSCDLQTLWCHHCPDHPTKKKKEEEAQMAAWDPDGVRKQRKQKNCGGFFICVSVTPISKLLSAGFQHWYPSFDTRVEFVITKRDLNSRSAYRTSFSSTLHWCQLISVSTVGAFPAAKPVHLNWS